MITNRDPGDETTYEACGEACYQYPNYGAEDEYPACAMPKGHVGQHSTWYYQHPPGQPFWADGPESILKIKKDETS